MDMRERFEAWWAVEGAASELMSPKVFSYHLWQAATAAADERAIDIAGDCFDFEDVSMQESIAAFAKFTQRIKERT